MNECHAINLSSAWEPPSGTSRAWVRRFGRPSGESAAERIWLVAEGGDRAALVLNGLCLSGSDGRHDVTALLESRNELLLIPGASDQAESVARAGEPSLARAHGRCDLDSRYGRIRLEIETITP